MTRTSYIIDETMHFRFELDHHEELDFYSASSQKSPDRHVAPLRHIIPIPSQPSALCVCKIQEPNDNACVHMNLPSIHRPC